MRRWRLPPVHWRRLAPRLLLAAAAAALAAGLLHPPVTVQRDLFDHVVVLDITQSMNVADLRLNDKPVSRLAFAKHALRNALLALPCGSRVGWAVFTEYRSLLLLAPLEVCANLSELRATLEHIDARMAWSGNSEIGKGLHSALGIARQLPDKPSLVFVSDGHEAPPIDPRFRRPLDDVPGAVPGLVVGVGDLSPSPIPKTDPDGRPLGFWRADEVLQTDPRRPGRSDLGVAAARSDADIDAAKTAAASGTEHLSALHEDHLRGLAGQVGLRYLRLQDADALATALTTQALARVETTQVDAQPSLAVVALMLLLGWLAIGSWDSWRRAWARFQRGGTGERLVSTRR